jgi:hypothetical protein
LLTDTTEALRKFAVVCEFMYVTIYRAVDPAGMASDSKSGITLSPPSAEPLANVTELQRARAIVNNAGAISLFTVSPLGQVA